MTSPASLRRACVARRTYRGVAVSLALSLAAPSSRASPPQSAVEKLASDAFAEHEAGKHAEAIATYMKAYELSHAAAILFNIAMICDRSLRERALAMEYFRRYLQSPDAEPEFVQKATERLTALKREVDEEDARRALAPPPEPAPILAPPRVEERSGEAHVLAVTPPPPSPPDGSDRAASASWRMTGILVGGVGLAGVAVSLALGLAAKTKNDEANLLCGPSTCRTAQGVAADHQAAQFATASTVAFVMGAALVATAVTVYLAAPGRRSSPAKLALEWEARPGGAGMLIRGSF